MHIHTEQDITGAVARTLREQRGLSQHAFWRPLGITQSGGCRYETAASAAIPRPVRILLYLFYVVSLPVDASTPAGAARLAELAQLAASQGAADRAKLGAALAEASALMRRASRKLASVTD